MTEPYLSAKEAREFIGVSKSTFERIKHELPRYPIPGTELVKYLRTDLAAWMQSNKKEAA